MNKQLISQEQQMRDDFNLFWNQFMKNSQPVDYYGMLSPEQLIGLKKVLSDVNNIITMRVTLEFAKTLLNNQIINPVQYCEICRTIRSKGPNCNGFDVEYDGSKIQIVAEVKCNIPESSAGFKGNQITHIKCDINNLQKGKSKSKIKNIKNAYKFFVLLDDGQYVTQAMNNLIYLKNWGNIIKDITQFNPNDRNSIYLVYIPINSI